MLLRSLLPLSFAIAVGGCSGTVGTDGAESTADLKKVPAAGRSFTTFETLQVRPLALSPSGKMLFAANTPDNRLELFRVGNSGLTSIGSVVVGLEPIAVAARNDHEVWVVNHLSDSVSVVHIDDQLIATVTRTLLVGDEPRDIVFGGSDRSRAFITTAHRGQNSPDAYDLQTAGSGRADVWVFDANNPGAAAGGQRLAKLTLFADTPRALAVSADGGTVYAAAFNSGNQTTSVSEYAVKTMYPAGMPGPATITIPGIGVVPMPPTGLIVKFNGSHWVDAYGTVFDPFVKVKLPDLDVFAIDANANPPVAKANGAYAHVGTTLFNMAVNPRSGKVYVTNTDAHNDVRFEGHTPGFTSVVGHLSDSRITVIDPAAGTVTPHNLNPHIDYTQPGNDAEKALSLAFPEGVAVSGDGATLYTIAQGSQKLAIYPTAALEAGNVAPTFASQVVLSGGGPTGLAVDDAAKRAYVLTRFDNSISVVDLSKHKELQSVAMYNPEPDSVTRGRKYLYDATLTSAHGDSACASCHIGGDKDELAWDLGNPGGFPLSITHASAAADTAHANIFTIDPGLLSALLPPFAPTFLYNMPVKGPMTTQSLRGMDNHGPMHWRGDRNGAVNQDGSPVIDAATGAPVISAQPSAGLFDEVRAFKSFNVAFPGLVGNGSMLSDADMTDFTTFILQVSYPPNPIRNLDNSLTAEQQVGHDFFFNHVDTPNGPVPLPSDRFHNCNGCHTLDATANQGTSAHPGFFGTDGKLSFEFETQIFKVPHLRNLYTKVGMFLSSPDTLQPGTLLLAEQQGPAMDEVRGFGFQHDGSLGQLEHFFTGQVFLQTDNDVVTGGAHVGPNPYGIPFIDPNSIGSPTGPVLQGDGGFALRQAIVAFMLAFDSNEAPIVGQQMTLTAFNASSAGPRVDLLEARARAGECELVAKSGSIGGIDAGFLYGAGTWQPSSMRLPPVSDAALRGLVMRGALPSLTFTCVPLGSGVRVALDRDGDGYADGDELLARTNPANPSSHP
jgi:DNA-binding beta-propeller fold protein YncE